VAEGLLREITKRRTARIWSVPGLAERLAARPRKVATRPPTETVVPDPQAGRAAMARAFADLDAALGRADLLLGRRRGG
jgi:hypothetical protein